MAVIWGRDDRVIPVRHASNAAALAPNARIEVIPHAGHFPHKDHPQRFAKIVHEFIRSTQPASYSRRPVPRPAQDRPVRAGQPGRLGPGRQRLTSDEALRLTTDPYRHRPDRRRCAPCCRRRAGRRTTTRVAEPFRHRWRDHAGPRSPWSELPVLALTGGRRRSTTRPSRGSGQCCARSRAAMPTCTAGSSCRRTTRTPTSVCCSGTRTDSRPPVGTAPSRSGSGRWTPGRVVAPDTGSVDAGDRRAVRRRVTARVPSRGGAGGRRRLRQRAQLGAWPATCRCPPPAGKCG